MRIERVGYAAGWDAAIDEACKKARVLQDGFRALLKDARGKAADMKYGRSPSPALENQISQGEALVGTLGDVIRNIAELKGKAPPTATGGRP